MVIYYLARSRLVAAKGLKIIFEARNSKLNTGLLSLDVRTTFDSLDHNILLMKLQTLGASGKILNQFSSYLD